MLNTTFFFKFRLFTIFYYFWKQKQIPCMNPNKPVVMETSRPVFQGFPEIFTIFSKIFKIHSICTYESGNWVNPRQLTNVSRRHLTDFVQIWWVDERRLNKWSPKILDFSDNFLPSYRNFKIEFFQFAVTPFSVTFLFFPIFLPLNFK